MTEFGDTQLQHTRRKEGKDCLKRFCISCGMAKSIYTPGSLIAKGGVSKWLCRNCKVVEDETFCEHCARCGRCIQNTLADCPRCYQRKQQTPLENPNWQGDPVSALALAMRVADFENEFGMVASPEWFDGDDLP